MQKSLAHKLETNLPSSPISRTDSTHTTFSTLDKSSVSSVENSPKPQRRTRKGMNLRSHKPILKAKKAPKVCNPLPRISSNKVTELLDLYREKSSQYREEEFTQQACSFIAKISSDEKIPANIRGRFSLYYILVSIAKIFMLNEYELTILACTLEHYNWNMDEVVLEDEGELLREFPCSLEVDITDDCKILIIYLLVLAFSLKSTLNKKEDVEMIQAYCEKICKNFRELVQRSSDFCSCSNVTFSPLEVNEKFAYLSKKDHKEPFMKILKDYNMVVESILRLTGSHTIKPKPKTAVPSTPRVHHKLKKFEDLHTKDLDVDTDIFYADFNKDLETYKLPNISSDFVPMTANYKADDIDNLKREASYDDIDEEHAVQKKIRYNDDTVCFLHETVDCGEDGCERPSFLENQKQLEPEDFLNMTELSRKSSSFIHQLNDEMPSFTRFDSTFSAFNK